MPRLIGGGERHLSSSAELRRSGAEGDRTMRGMDGCPLRLPTTTAIVSCLLVALTTAGCGNGSAHPTATLPTAAPRPSTTTVVTPTTLGGSAGAASRQACQEDARLVQQASDAYQLKNGHPAASIDVLVADGALRSAPSTAHGYVISYDGRNGTVTATGACDVP